MKKCQRPPSVADPRIINIRVLDLRFPTSRDSIGSDAVNKHPDYSATYCILETDAGLTGYGLTFTLGRGNELCKGAAEYLATLITGRRLSELTRDIAAFSRKLTDENQFRWLGPEKGVIHLGAAALINAVWDLWARQQGKPLWRLLAEMSPEQLVAAIDFRYITDALTPERAFALLTERRRGYDDRLASLEATGIPPTPLRQAGSASPMKKYATYAVLPEPRAGHISSSRWAASRKTTCAARAWYAKRSAGTTS